MLFFDRCYYVYDNTFKICNILDSIVDNYDISIGNIIPYTAIKISGLRDYINSNDF